MSATIMGADLAVLVRDADRTASRAVARGRLPSHAREDLRQDMLLDLLSRLRHFDPSRGPIGAFAQVCFMHRAGYAVGRYRRERHVSQAYWHDAAVMGTAAHEPNIELKLDLSASLGALPADDVALVRSVVEGRGWSGPRTTRFRRLRALRERLAAFGPEG